MIFLVCPQDTFKYFKHVIISLSYELINEDLQAELLSIDTLQEIQTKRNDILIFFGFQRFLRDTPSENVMNIFANNYTIVYNFEQLQSGNWDYLLKIIPFINQWWDYSLINIEYIKKKSISCIFKYIPFGYSKILEMPLSDDLDDKTLTLFGTYHPRRENLCRQLQSILPTHTVVFNHSDSLFYQDYDTFVCSHSLYLNFHYYTPSILEIVRLVPLLTQGHLVISERSDDLNLDKLFEPYVIWLDQVNTEKINTHNSSLLRDQFKTLSFYKFLDEADVFDQLSLLNDLKNTTAL